MQFQEPAVYVPSRLRQFPGKNIEQMHLLLSGEDESEKVIDVKRLPITPKQLLHERVDLYRRGRDENEPRRESFRHDGELLIESGFQTGYVAIGDPDGSKEVIIGRYSDPLVKELVHSLNPKSLVKNGSLWVEPSTYQTIKKNGAFVIPPDEAVDLAHFHNNAPNLRKEFWKYSAEDAPELVEETLSLLGRMYNGKMGDHGDMRDRMGLSPSPYPGLRLVYLGSLTGRFGAGTPEIDSTLNYNLLGVAAEPIRVVRGDSGGYASPFSQPK